VTWILPTLSEPLQYFGPVHVNVLSLTVSAAGALDVEDFELHEARPRTTRASQRMPRQ
jgi:hypothetical protein